ncbi:MAG: V-type ATPase subunit [candidate division WOR-3 bacterium]
MRFSEDPNYGFAVGRVRAREVFLLRRPDYDRLVSLENEAELLKELRGRMPLEFSEEPIVSLENLLEVIHTENRVFFQKYSQNPDLYALITERAVLAKPILFEYLRRLNNDFLNYYFKTAIDLENIRNALRIKYLIEKTEDNTTSIFKNINRIWLKGGEFTSEDAVKYFVEPWSTIIEWVAKTKYALCLTEGIEYLISQNSFLRLERKIEEEKQKILLLTRYLVFGYEPLIAYYLFRENEIRNLRRIALGIKAKIPRERLKENIVCVL